MNELDKVVNDFVEGKKQKLLENGVETDDIEDLAEALKEKTKNNIVSEIREEYKKELKKEIANEMKEESHNKRIKDLKTIMWEGFFIAFVVGLTTNQVTDIISHFKGVTVLPSVWTTIIIATIFGCIAVGFYLYTFFSNVLSMINEYKDKKK